MAMPASFTDLIDALAGGRRKRTKLAVQLGRTYWQVNYWARINNIPEEFWDDVTLLASEKNFEGVTRDYLKTLKRRKLNHG